MTGEQSLSGVLERLAAVFGTNPTAAIGQIERAVPNFDGDASTLREYLERVGFSSETYRAALELKRAAGQVNVLVHAAGILYSLPRILEPGEKVIALSLGAGNTGKEFDLETDRRIAEFKFIAWRGGPEAIRQNQLFKDFLKLLWDQSERRKQLYLTGTKEAYKFLRGGRALSSVLSRGDAVKQAFYAAYGETFYRVGEFYAQFEDAVEIVDIADVMDEFNPPPIPPESTLEAI